MRTRTCRRQPSLRGTLACAARAAGLTLLASLTVQSPASAQEGGTVTGRVTNERGEAVPSAQVFVEEIGVGTLTRGGGRYLIQNVPSGSYTLRVTIIGYRAASRSITVRAGQTVEADFALEQDLLNLEALVVTATRAPRTKLESSTAITNIPEAEIDREMPRSTADLIKVVPGFYVESSGGEVGNNVWARGLPQDGAYRYIALMEEGIPVFDATELFFVNSDIFVRVDENIERLEAVRGGNSALFGSNAPGGVINFISKTGGSERSGSFKAETGTDGLARIAGNLNGPLGDAWRFSIGGFYRYDDGVRDPGFAASNGGQIKGNLTYQFDRGHVRLYAKYLNDENMFFLPIPFRNPPDPQLVQGFPENGTMTTDEGDGIPIFTGPNSSFAMPLEDGQKQVGGSAILDVVYSLGGGWTLQNKARYMSVDHEWNAMLPFSARPRADVAADFVEDGSLLASVEFTPVDGGDLNAPNDLLAVQGLWHVEKPMSNFSDQLQIEKLIGRNQITLGGYFGHYEADNTWFFNNVLTTVESAPRLVDVVVREPLGGGTRQVTDNGVLSFVNTFVNAEGTVDLFSVFAGDEIEVNDRLRVDMGARFEHADYEQLNEATETTTAGRAAEADDAIQVGSGDFTKVTREFDEWAASVGVNYLVTDNISVYGRGSRGYRMPLLDRLFDPGFDGPAETLYQLEGGVKASSRFLGLSAVGYWLRLEDFPSSDVRVVDGETQIVVDPVGEARTMGAEIEVVLQPAAGLRLAATGTFQEAEYTDFATTRTTAEGTPVRVDLAGNRIRRVPRVVLGLDGFYQTPLGLGLGAEWNFVGHRYSNDLNTVDLEEFGYVNARLEYQIPGSALTLAAGVLNLLESEGLTEGNPRTDETLGAERTIFFARPLLPRRWTLTARYVF